MNTELKSSLFKIGLAIPLALLVCSLLPQLEEASPWGLFPPILAILVAVLSRRLILGLSLAVISGGLLATPDLAFAPFLATALRKIFVSYLFEPLFDSFSLYILGFTALLIGMVRVTSLAGGNRGIAELLSQGAAGARSCRLATFLMGLAASTKMVAACVAVTTAKITPAAITTVVVVFLMSSSEKGPPRRCKSGGRRKQRTGRAMNLSKGWRP